jgi:hypothetical protein
LQESNENSPQCQTGLTPLLFTYGFVILAESDRFSCREAVVRWNSPSLALKDTQPWGIRLLKADVTYVEE